MFDDFWDPETLRLWIKEGFNARIQQNERFRPWQAIRMRLRRQYRSLPSIRWT
jgi:hypothetical protein